MKEFRYQIIDELGLHARPAGQLVKTASVFHCKITVEGPGKTVDAKRIMGVMGLALKQGDEITVTCDGMDEEEAIKALESFLRGNL